MIKKIFLTMFFLVLFTLNSWAENELDSYRNRNIESANNYIYLLIHGTGGSASDLDELYNFMTKSVSNGGLGLTKVYRYSFKDKFGSLKDWANEIDQHMIKTQESIGTTEAEFVFVCHSAGGLAARYYVNNSGLYKGNIKKILTIVTPHLGSSSGKASVWANRNAPYRYWIPMILTITAYSPRSAFSNTALASSIKSFAAYYFWTSAITDAIAALKIDRGPYQLVLDQEPNSQILNEINNASPPSNNEPDYTLISVGGLPAANDINSEFAYFTELAVPLRIGSSLVIPWANPDMGSVEEKMTSSLVSMVFGYPFFEDGDFVSPSESQQANRVANLSKAKRIHYIFRSSSMAALSTAVDSALALSYIVPWPAYIGIAICAGLYTAGQINQSGDENDYSLMNYLTAHNETIIKSAIFKLKDFNGTKTTYLEHALFDTSVSGSSTGKSVKQYSLSLSSNLTKEASGKVTALSTYHPVTPEAITESTTSTSILPTPVVIDGKEKQIASITVKEPPTRIEGVLRDFMPLKMQYFQYSENFAAWKDIKILDEWGKFQIDGLKLAEGQNMIAFRAKNKVGYESNQHLKIILNTIPMLISKMTPAPNTYNNNPKPTISAEFNKSVYVTNTNIGEGIPDITSAKLYRNEELYLDLLSDPNFKEENVKVNDYLAKGKFSWTPSSSLDDGEYKMIVNSKSEVGISQGVWSFWIDTKPPEIRIGSLEVISLKGKPVALRYFVDDDQSAVLKNMSIEIKDKCGNVIATLASYEALSKGEHFVVIDPAKFNK